MQMSNYPNGFNNGVTVRGMPILNSYSGNVIWVDSGSSLTGEGTYTRPYTTIDTAVGKCTANNGDIIMVKAGHAETVASAGAINLDVAGVTVICLGDGADRPTFTFSDTASTITMTAASCSILGYPLIVPSVDSVVSPVVISAADCTAEVEVKDASDTVECVRAVLTTAAADRANINIRYLGRTGGDACVNAVRLVGGDGIRVNIDGYGIFSTAAVEFHTTACTDVVVNGYIYNSGTTDGSKLVVDTVTGSTWYASIADGAAGATFSGGSGGALAADDVGAVASLIGTTNLTTTDNLHGKIGTDTEMADRSVFDILGGDGLAAFPAAAAAANDVSIAEVVRYISENQSPRIVTKSTGDLTAFGTSLSLFTVTGDVLVKVGGSVDVAATSTSGTTTLEVGVAGNTACLCVQDAVDNTAFAIGDSWTLDTAADANGAQLSTEWVLVGNGEDIILTGSVDDITAGDIDFYCLWKPLSADGSVVAA